MASNSTRREIINESSTKDPHERSQELTSVGLDVSTEEGQLPQTCTSSTEGEATILKATLLLNINWLSTSIITLVPSSSTSLSLVATQ
jgi:hypothetical protein